MAKVTFWQSERKGRSTIDWFSEVINEVLETAKREEQTEIEKRKSTSSLENLEVMPIPNKIEPFNWNFPNQFYSGYGYFDSKTASKYIIDGICEKSRKYLDEQEQKIEEIHAGNIEAIENNQLIVAGISKMMEKFGVNEKYREYDYPSPRSRTKKWVDKSCYWKSEVLKFVPTSDQYNLIKSSIQKYRDSIIKFETEHHKRIQQIEIEKTKELEKQKEVHLLAQYRVKYELPWDASWPDILDQILAKNKYLCLAYWLERNRGDWTSGYDFAQTGIEAFEVENETDKLIHDEIYDLAYNSDGFYDGRCFRDCTWNYSVLYSMVNDENLMADFNEVRNFTNKF